MTHDVLRQLLYDNLHDLLGIYQDGSPALANMLAGIPKPDIRARGLEVIIEPDPDDGGFAVHHHSRTEVQQWTVRLVQHGPGSLYEARSRLQDLFPDADVQMLVYSDPILPTQAVVQIYA